MNLMLPADFVVTRASSAALGTALIALAGWVALRNLSRPSNDGWIFWVPIALWLVTMGLLCWGSALVNDLSDTRRRIRASWRAGSLVGGVGLVLGFVAPLLLIPKANLGPLLGILLTGPLGFVVGALTGVVGRPKRTA